MGLPGFDRSRPATVMGYAVFYASLAAVYFVAGSLLRKRPITGARIGLIVAGVVTGIQLFGLTSDTELSPATTAILVLNLAILLLLAFNWRHLGRSPRLPDASPPRRVSAPSKVILGLLAVCALLLITPVGWFILMYMGNYVLVFCFIFAYVVLWAIIDLVRFATIRTLVNIAIALLGLVAAVMGILASYGSSTYTGPPL
jgi:hypothetical protein